MQIFTSFSSSLSHFFSHFWPLLSFLSSGVTLTLKPCKSLTWPHIWFSVPDASELMDFSRLFGSSLISGMLEGSHNMTGIQSKSARVWQRGCLNIRSLFDTAWEFSFHLQPQFPGPLQSCGAVTSHEFVFSTSTSIIHTGVKHYL